MSTRLTSAESRCRRSLAAAVLALGLVVGPGLVGATSSIAVDAADAHSAPAQIAGRVFGPGGVPVFGVQVDAYFEAASGEITEVRTYPTTETGQYVFTGLAAGTYLIGFEDPTQKRFFTEFWDNQPDLTTAVKITIAAGERRPGISAHLMAGGRVTGTVSGTGSLPLDKITATAYRREGQQWSISTWAPVAADGSYLLGPLKPGAHRIGFEDARHGYAPQYWDDKTNLARGTVLLVNARTDATGVDARLHPGSHITGRLTDAQHRPISGVSVAAYHLNPATRRPGTTRARRPPRRRRATTTSPDSRPGDTSSASIPPAPMHRSAGTTNRPWTKPMTSRSEDLPR